MQDGLDDRAPDPGMLYLAIGIGVFSVLASFMLAIYCSGAGNVSAASQPIGTDPDTEVGLEAGIESAPS